MYTYTAERRDVLGCTSPTTKRFPEAREMSRGRSPRDISRAEGNLEVGGDVQPNSSRFEAVYGHSLIINPSLGMYQEIHPCRASSTYSVKINTSLPMMRECTINYIEASFRSRNLLYRYSPTLQTKQCMKSQRSFVLNEKSNRKNVLIFKNLVNT